jgi:hypothetical protein
MAQRQFILAVFLLGLLAFDSLLLSASALKQDVGSKENKKNPWKSSIVTNGAS